MSRLLIYHNGECSKCKGLYDILAEKGVEADYKFYLHEALTVEELKGLLNKLQLSAKEILRTSEPLFATQFEGKELSDEVWLQAIVDNPVLLQRPIVVNGDKAIIARPPEKVVDIL